MKVVELTRRVPLNYRPDGYEDHPFGVEIGHLAGVDDLAVLVDVNRENPVWPGATTHAAASECGRYDVRITRIAIQLNSVAFEVARDPEAFQLIVGGLQEVGQDVVELDHPEIGARVFGRLCAVNSVP